MSKRNRYKFRDRDSVRSAVVEHRPVASPVAASSGAEAAHSAEYKIIRNDMIRLVVLNGIMLAAVLVVYFTNRSSGYLERLFERLF